jgi:hypothetical protein
MEIKVPISICADDFYLVAKISNNDFHYCHIERNKKKTLHIEFDVYEDEIIRFDEKDIMKQDNLQKTNIIQVNFKTGERKYL